MPDWMLGLRETAPGMEGTSGRDAFGDTNPFDVHFPDPAEPAGEAPALPGDESNTDAVLSPPTVLPAEFVRELVPAEGHMINPMTGEPKDPCCAPRVLPYLDLLSLTYYHYIHLLIVVLSLFGSWFLLRGT